MNNGSESSRVRVAVAQLGARVKYAVPIALQRAGMLGHLYTDGWANRPLRDVVSAVPRWLRPAPLQWLLTCSCPVEHPGVTSFFSLGLAYRWKQRTARDRSELTAAFLWAGERFDQLILESGGPTADAVYGFHGASRTLFRHCRERGMVCILEQSVAPWRLQNTALAEELDLWPGWEPVGRDTCGSVYAEREAAEWQLADLIIAGSEFVVDGLAACGVNRAKCAVVPLGVNVRSRGPARAAEVPAGPLRVVYAGAIGLRGGVQYLLQAARKLPTRLHARIVGPICCNRRTLAAALPANVEIVGRVPRSELLRHLAWADVFCAPSVTDGMAAATREALAAGLPVVCTSSTGSIVRDGVDGYIVPVRDTQALADRLDALAGDRALLAELARNARRRAGDHSCESHARRLTDAVQQAAARPQVPLDARST